MAGTATIEGRQMMAQYLATLGMEVGLFTNASVNSNTLLSEITEPTGGGYSRLVLTAGNWANSGDSITYNAAKSFVAGVGGMVGSIKGYFICTTDTPKKLIEYDLDGNLGSGLTLTAGSNYDVTPTLKFSPKP